MQKRVAPIQIIWKLFREGFEFKAQQRGSKCLFIEGWALPWKWCAHPTGKMWQIDWVCELSWRMMQTVTGNKGYCGGGGHASYFWDFVGLEKNNGLDFMRYKDWASGNLGYHIEPKKNTGETWSFHCCPSYCCGWEVVLGFSAKSMKPILQQTKTDTQTNK